MVEGVVAEVHLEDVDVGGGTAVTAAADAPDAGRAA